MGNQNKNRHENAVIEESKRLFRVYVALPIWITIFWSTFAVIAAVIQAFVFEWEAWLLLLALFTDGVSAILIYIILKLRASYKILHIYYLEKLVFNENTKNDNFFD